MATVPQELDHYAQEASSQTGLSKKVIEAQWIAENGWRVPTGYNFANIRYDPTYSNSGFYKGIKLYPVPQKGDFVNYNTGEDGVQAYKSFLQQPNYAGVMAAKGKSDKAQMDAIVASPWDEGHYGGDGHKLYDVYQSITGVSVGGYDGADAWNQTSKDDSGGGDTTEANKEYLASRSVFGQISKFEKVQGYSDWKNENPDASIWDYAGTEIGHSGVRLVVILLGLLLVIFGLVEGVLPAIKK